MRNDDLNPFVSESLAREIFRADQAYSIFHAIARNAREINERNYGDLFGTIQGVMFNQASLAISKLFERPSQQLPNHSIPSLVAFLRDAAPGLRVHDQLAIERFIGRAGVAMMRDANFSDFELTSMLADAIDAELPNEAVGGESWHAFIAHRTRRDKIIAHPEIIDLKELPSANWDRIRHLLDLVRAVMSAVGAAYLKIVYQADDGFYLLESDADRTGTALERLLRDAGVIPDRRITT